MYFSNKENKILKFLAEAEKSGRLHNAATE